jgi:hypothetical protein
MPALSFLPLRTRRLGGCGRVRYEWWSACAIPCSLSSFTEWRAGPHAPADSPSSSLAKALTHTQRSCRTTSILSRPARHAPSTHPSFPTYIHFSHQLVLVSPCAPLAVKRRATCPRHRVEVRAARSSGYLARLAGQSYFTE